MERNKKAYVGEKSLSLPGFPDICEVNVNRIKARCSNAGFHPIAAASIFYGLSEISNQACIRSLLRLKYRFDNAPSNIPGPISKVISEFLGNFSVSLPHGNKRQNIFIPETHHSSLARIAKELGTSFRSFAVLSIMYTLSEQRESNVDNCEEMKRFLSKFFEDAEIKARAIRALMDEFAIPETGENPLLEQEEFYGPTDDPLVTGVIS